MPLFLLIGTLAAQNISFKDMAVEMGLNFVHDHGGTDQKFYVETMGSGCAILDYDDDGDLDIFLLQGAPLPGWKKKTTLRNQLFRNDGDQFTDVTGESGLGDTSYGIGCAAADYDNDGDTDLYVTNFGPDILYRNEGDGTFADASYAAGISNPLWSASAAFFDAENDGWLDLFVSNYVEYSLEKNPWCGDQRKDQRAYCDPDVFMGISDIFYHNNGDGTFSNMSEKSNVIKGKGKGLGVIPSDFDNDGDMDVYVANDKVMNNLFINDGTGIFKEDALFAGVGFNENGQAEAGMGVDFADYNRDGWLDLFVTNFSGESNTLYRNDKNGFLTDVTFAAGLGQPSLEVLGFGTNFVDLDLDGWEDIFVANGHVIDNIELLSFEASYRATIKVSCTKGTYIRSLVKVIGRSLGTNATVMDLRRTKVGSFSENDLYKLGKLDILSCKEAIIDCDSMLEDLPKVTLNILEVKKIRNGQQVDYNAGQEKEGIVRIYEEKGSFIGLGNIDSSMQVSPVRLLSAQVNSTLSS